MFRLEAAHIGAITTIIAWKEHIHCTNSFGRHFRISSHNDLVHKFNLLGVTIIIIIINRVLGAMVRLSKQFSAHCSLLPLPVLLSVVCCVFGVTTQTLEGLSFNFSRSHYLEVLSERRGGCVCVCASSASECRRLVQPRVQSVCFCVASCAQLYTYLSSILIPR